MTVDRCGILAPFCFSIFDSSLKQFMYGKLTTQNSEHVIYEFINAKLIGEFEKISSKVV